jgi:hypothetical protein
MESQVLLEREPVAEAMHLLSTHLKLSLVGVGEGLLLVSMKLEKVATELGRSHFSEHPVTPSNQLIVLSEPVQREEA